MPARAVVQVQVQEQVRTRMLPQHHGTATRHILVLPRLAFGATVGRLAGWLGNGGKCQCRWLQAPPTACTGMCGSATWRPLNLGSVPNSTWLTASQGRTPLLRGSRRQRRYCLACWWLRSTMMVPHRMQPLAPAPVCRQ